MTLADLGLDSLMGVEVKQVLERDLDLVLQTKDIRLLTFAKIKELSSADSSATTKQNGADPKNATKADDKSNLAGKEKLMPTNNIVKMSSKESASAVQPLFVVHPIEGTVTHLQIMTSQLHGDVYGLQFTAEAPTTSVQELASHYINVSIYLKYISQTIIK